MVRGPDTYKGETAAKEDEIEDQVEDKHGEDDEGENWGAQGADMEEIWGAGNADMDEYMQGDGYTASEWEAIMLMEWERQNMEVGEDEAGGFTRGEWGWDDDEVDKDGDADEDEKDHAKGARSSSGTDSKDDDGDEKGEGTNVHGSSTLRPCLSHHHHRHHHTLPSNGDGRHKKQARGKGPQMWIHYRVVREVA